MEKRLQNIRTWIYFQVGRKPDEHTGVRLRETQDRVRPCLISQGSEYGGASLDHTVSGPQINKSELLLKKKNGKWKKLKKSG